MEEHIDRERGSSYCQTVQQYELQNPTSIVARSNSSINFWTKIRKITVAARRVGIEPH